jgi:anti-anti-sigma factor
LACRMPHGPHARVLWRTKQVARSPPPEDRKVSRVAHRRVSEEGSAFVSGERVFTVKAFPEMAEFRLNMVPGCVLVTAAGEVDVATAPALREALWEGLVQSPRIVVDLSDVRFLDSTGLQVLVTALKHAQQGGGCLTLVQPTPCVQRVLQITQLDRILPVRWDLAEPVAVAVAEATR